MTIEKDYLIEGLGVRCACYVEYYSSKELETLDFDSLPRPFLHIGSGTCLKGKTEFEGTVLHSGITYLKYVDMGFNEVPVMVGSGLHFDTLVEEIIRQGLSGAEQLASIRGEVGAAVVLNPGAFGSEVKDIVSGVVCYDIQDRRKLKFSVAECEYGNGESIFTRNPGRYIVTSVLVRFRRRTSTCS